MKNTEQPQTAQYNWRTCGAVSHTNKEKNMNNTTTGWDSKQDFVEYLTDTLIPDLKESGMDATAEDFETAVHFMKGGK
jgi:hypothetical protein